MIRAKTYRDASAAIDDRVGDLLAQMTLDEKLAQLERSAGREAPR